MGTHLKFIALTAGIVVGTMAGILLSGVAVKGSSLNTIGWTWGGTTDDSFGTGASIDTATGLGWASVTGNSLPCLPINPDCYGLTIPQGDGNVTGYVWSPNVGWIDFQPIGEPPLSGCNPACPSTGVVRTGDALSGWARIVAIADEIPTDNNGGYSGWIKMRGTTENGQSYGVNVVSGATTPGYDSRLSGYAWSEDFGFIYFGSGYPNPPFDNPPFPEFSDGSTAPVVTITAPDSDAAETTPPNPQNNGKFRITRDGPTTAALVVTFGISGSADNADYEQITSPVTIPIGDSFVDIIVTPNDDTTSEGSIPETVILTLGTSVNYEIEVGSGSATVFITDNDVLACGDASAPFCGGSCPGIQACLNGYGPGGVGCGCTAPSLAVTCTGSPSSGRKISWSADASGGNNSNYSYQWTFPAPAPTNITPNSTSNPITATYSANGSKGARVDVTDGSGASAFGTCNATAVQLYRFEIPPFFF